MSDEGRAARVRVASETQEIVRAGRYSSAGAEVDIAEAVERAVAAAEAVSPAAMSVVVERARRRAASSSRPAVEVTGESTLAAARRLAVNGCRPLCLNFASARRPGGGFLSGARAQEESICRGSALYATLIACREYYEANRAWSDLHYSDWAIYSPDVPVIRDDGERLLPTPVLASFLTMPAPNRGGGGRLDEGAAAETLRRRIAMVLAFGAARGHDVLVLGAWGCGAFGNDAQGVAPLFREALDEPALASPLSRVVFAVLEAPRDRERGNRAAFEAAFAAR